ncbi:MAG: ribonuclease P protein component [Patescibacteria group bacterium]
MLPAWRKLRSKRDFNCIYKYGCRVTCPFFVMWYLATHHDQPTKFAVVTSIKKMGKAVIRNRGRRRFWALLSQQIGLTPPLGYWLVFNLNKNIIKASWIELQQAFKQIIQKIR